MDVLLQLLLSLPFILLGLTVGRWNQRRHLRRIAEREAALSDMTVSELKTFPGGCDPSFTPRLLDTGVVIGSDQWKRFLAGYRKLAGGELRGYTPMMERARREAILRLLESARALGYNAVCNIRLETAVIGGQRQRAMILAAIIASGTAYRTATR
jgi:uncharacterized protein YbjQ (UPF0145 family)